ncbi:hypothetical protein [Bacillus sp. FJAT-26390]|uniref:hypothetical protein n=1 Tax=Bacillus sp. FJAT-26390 TaxID=1743142 RepID=UPI00080801F1|nr:hypothetical protein [Bacillus sp. FJAT-26390]OBZ11382.1 hypothetical protein A7975_20825 [Bacillus sp. FJAT-26390]
MKIFSRIILLIIGLYVIYQGYTIYTFSARSNGSMGIRKFIWLFIPATDYHLHTYGIAFIVIGVIITITSVALYRMSLKGKKTVQ